MSGVLAVRVKSGLVDETKRVVHAVVVPRGTSNIITVTTVCGLVLSGGTVDILPRRTGMPCLQCTARMTTSGATTQAER